METLFYDLSAAEFSKGRKILIWILAALFFIAGLWDLFANLVLKIQSLSLNLAIVPLSISLFIALFALFATIKRKDHFFRIDNDKIEFKNGAFNPKKHSFLWSSIAEIHLPLKQKRAILLFQDGTKHNIDLMWIEKKKAISIRRQLFCLAKEKNIKLLKI